MIRTFVSFAVVLASSVATATAQEGIKSPRDAAVVERGVALTANIDGAPCTIRAALRREGTTNRFHVEVDGVGGGYFKSDGTLDPARCKPN